VNPARAAAAVAEKLPEIAAGMSAILDIDCVNPLVQLRACKAYIETAGRARVARLRKQCPALVAKMEPLDARGGVGCLLVAAAVLLVRAMFA
jgi:hypothetical protein